MTPEEKIELQELESQAAASKPIIPARFGFRNTIQQQIARQQQAGQTLEEIQKFKAAKVHEARQRADFETARAAEFARQRDFEILKQQAALGDLSAVMNLREHFGAEAGDAAARARAAYFGEIGAMSAATLRTREAEKPREMTTEIKTTTPQYLRPPKFKEAPSKLSIPEKIEVAATRSQHQIESFVDPELKQRRQFEKDLFAERKAQSEDYENKFYDYNEKFAGKFLTEAEYAVAEPQAIKLQKQAEKLTTSEQQLDATLKKYGVAGLPTIEQKPERNIQEFSKVIPAVTYGAVAFGASLITKKDYAKRAKKFFIDFSKEAKKSPFGVFSKVGFGIVAGGTGGLAVRKGATSIIDVARTAGLKQIPAEVVIAPEYFKGQNYPKIKKGQTAGELFKEFYKPVLPTETPGTARAFTASPGDFAKETLTGGGSSEVPGLFGSPKISPTFLKLTGENAPLRLGLLEPLKKPTTIRLKLSSLEYASNIKPYTKTPTGFYPKSFFESIKGTGRSVLPFAKTEKELVTAVNTPIQQTGKNYYFKFGGRRVPIKEFEVIASLKKGKSAAATLTLKEAVRSSSLSALKSSSIIPSNILFTPPARSSQSKPYQKSAASLLSLPSKVYKSSSRSPKYKGYSLPSSYSSYKSPASRLTLPSLTSPPSSPVLRSPFRMPSLTSPPSTPSRRTPPRTPPIPAPYRFPRPRYNMKQELKRQRDLFRVELRRNKKFFNIGFSPTLQGASLIGQRAAKRSLARTFRVRGRVSDAARLNLDTRMFRTPRGKARFKEAPFTFIEKVRFSLNTPSEIRELTSSRKKK